MKINKQIYLTTLAILASRYEAYCMSLTARGGVASPRHGTAMPRCRALPHAAMNMHYPSSNYGF